LPIDSGIADRAFCIVPDGECGPGHDVVSRIRSQEELTVGRPQLTRLRKFIDSSGVAWTAFVETIFLASRFPHC
jgi:hypothetical protein